jgi:hypothetical protein
MELSVLIVLIPHSNGELNIVGEDTTVYSDRIQDLKGSQDIEHFLSHIHWRSTPLVSDTVYNSDFIQ